MSAVTVDEALLGLKVAFLVLLYLFIWRVIRVASRDVEVGQESMVLAPALIGLHGDVRGPLETRDGAVEVPLRGWEIATLRFGPAT